MTCPQIEPGITKTFNVSLRFGRAGASVRDLAGDVIKGYLKKYPFQLNWTDRRPIAMIFLAGSGIKTPTNPRRWIMNVGKLDVTTDEGKADYRAAPLELAITHRV